MTENASADEEFVVDEMADNKQANKKKYRNLLHNKSTTEIIK